MSSDDAQTPTRPASAAAGEPIGQAPPPTTPPSPRRSRLGRVTTGAILVVLGGAWLLDRLEVIDVGVIEVLALALLIVGVGLLVGSWWGRSRGLIFWGVLLTVLLAGASAVQVGLEDADVLTSGGVGERTWAPDTPDQVEPAYELGMGEATLDLSQTAFEGRDTDVTARVGMGELNVYVPEDVDVTVDGTIRVGRMQLLGTSADGVGTVNRTVTDTVDDPDATLTIEASVGIGNLLVQRR